MGSDPIKLRLELDGLTYVLESWHKKKIRTATLDAMQAETDEIEKSEIWAQMGIPAECHGVYIEKFEEAIDNLRGES